MNVADYLLEGKDPAKPALEPLRASCSYGELTALVRATAAQLRQCGLHQGDRVLLIGENSVFWAGAYLAILRAGLVAVPLPAAVSPAHLQHIVAATEPRHAFLDPKVAVKLRDRLQELTLTTELCAGETVLDGASPAGDDDLAALMFTSGSTGTPRGVMISHRNIIANTESIIASLGVRPDDRCLAVLPFHYCFGTSLLHTHLRAGARLVLENRFLFPEVVLQRMRDAQCTSFAGVPSHYQILLRKSNLRRMQFPHLRFVQQAGGHLAPSFVRELREALPGTSVYIMYGQTEATARLACMPPDCLDRKPGSIGRPVPGVALRVVNESGEAAAPGEVGEIVAEGDNVARGYWRDEAETAATFRQGRLYTGDLARVDEDGFFYVVDRAREFLKCGGKRVSCRELEDAILECEEVLEAAIVGMQDEILGEAVKAFVVPRSAEFDGLEQRLRTFCKQRLALAFQPKEIVMLKALPKNSSGKIDKPALRAHGTAASS